MWQGDTKLIIENKVVTVTIVETAIRQPEKGTPVATMHYITCPSDPANDGWYDQAKLRLATTSAVVGSAVPAVVEGAGRVSRGGAKKVRGISAKAHLLDERKDASLKRLGSPVDKGSPANTAVRSGRRIDGRQSTDGGAPHSGCIDLTAPLDPASASASAEDELCTWVWYWREARSKRMPHRSSHSRTNGFNSMRWVETSRAKPTGSVAEGMARSETTSFAAAWLRQHIDELKKQSSTNVFLRRNSLQVCQHVLAAALLEDGSKSALRAPKCRGELEKSSQSQQELDVDRVTTESELDMMTSVPVPLHQAEEHQPAAPQAQGRKRSTVSTTKGQAASNALVANGSETSQTGTFDMQDSHPKRVKRNRLPSEKLGTTAAARTAAIPGQANQSMAMDNIAPTQALGTSRGKPQPDRAGNSQTQLQHLSTKRTAITVSALMDSCNASPSVSSSNNTNSADVGSQHTDQHAAQPPGRQAVMEDGQQTGAERPAHPDRSWSAAEETHLAELVSKYWPMIIDEAQRDGAPISPADSPAWVRISTELGTIKAIGTAHSDAEGVTAGLDVPLHSPESCNKHWTTVAKQMQAQQDAQERQKQAQQLEQHKRQAQDQEQEQQRKVLKQRQLLIVQQRDQLHFEQQQIVFAEVHRKLLQQHAAEKQQQHLAMQQQNRQYRSAIAQQQQQLINQCGGCPSPLQQQQLQQHQQLLLLQLQQQQLQQQQVLEQQHQQQVQQHQHQQAQSQRPLTSASVAAVLAEGYPSNVIGSLRVVYPLLHKMLRESGFGSNVMPLVGCHGQLMVKVSFSFRTPTPSAVKEGEPLVFTMKGAPWLRAMLYQNGVMQDCGFSWSPTDWLDLIETLQQLSSIVQQQSLADGLREALWRRDGRRRTYFCCLLRHPFQQRQSIQGCGIRLLDQNELRQHIAKDHANPPFQRHARIMSAEMEVLRRKRLTQLSAQQNVDSATGLECNVAAGRSLEDDHAWAVSQTEELLTNKLLSENLELFRARVKALRVQAGENADEDDDCMLAYVQSLAVVSRGLVVRSPLAPLFVCSNTVSALHSDRYERVSIRDGTTMTKMTCPGRTRRCKHLQCFDLRAHVQEAYRKRTTWAATGMLHDLVRIA